ncbi:hypothetical protein IV487_14420 [Enterococcus saccharolyticus]|uniref:hypothetical protein n=1 Tax=Enterococcus TaxID=1350 RepID=UPI001E41C14C|nr:hypothetical protein [Enterococcus saccharolyticus]MCD5003656.1 hypothetical protein [Enterococcus saccharolyticus]
MLETMLHVLFLSIPSCLLIFGGWLFILHKHRLWNNPLYLVFKNQRVLVNEVTGKLWIIGGIVTGTLIIIFRNRLTIPSAVIIYFITLVLDFLVAYFLIRKRVE